MAMCESCSSRFPRLRIGDTEQESEARAIIGPVVPGTVVPNGFRLPGTSYQMDPLKGSFDLGSLIRYLDHNDAFPGAEWGHPSGERGSDGDSICTQSLH
jgi:2-methylcitrate dehydratase PrpD